MRYLMIMMVLGLSACGQAEVAVDDGCNGSMLSVIDESCEIDGEFCLNQSAMDVYANGERLNRQSCHYKTFCMVLAGTDMRAVMMCTIGAVTPDTVETDN